MFRFETSSHEVRNRETGFEPERNVVLFYDSVVLLEQCQKVCKAFAECVAQRRRRETRPKRGGTRDAHNVGFSPALEAEELVAHSNNVNSETRGHTLHLEISARDVLQGGVAGEAQRVQALD